MHNFKNIFQAFSKLKVGVIGDVILDAYVWGNVDKISPEAPVPVVHIQNNENRAGGAANVALNIQAMNSKVFLLSMIGKDKDGNELENILKKNKVDTKYILKSSQRITTKKTRVICRNHQMLRLDKEQTSAINTKDEMLFLNKIQSFIVKEKPDIIIFEDYNKGALTERIITETIKICKAKKILTAVDPKKNNFFSYKNVDLFKPNFKEAKEAFQLENTEINLKNLQSIHKQLNKKLHHSISLITLSEKGIFYQQANKAFISPSHLRSIADVSGAGDTVIAIAALALAVTKNISLSAEIANIAGGIVCEYVGTEVIKKNILLKECERLLNLK